MKNMIIKILISSIGPLALGGCFEGGGQPAQPVTQPVTVVPDTQPVTKKPCEHGDAYPFDKCGKNFLKPLPLESLPRELPDLSIGEKLDDLRAHPDFVEKLSGEWVGNFFNAVETAEHYRIHWLFNPDQTFFASLFWNTRHESQPVQLFDMISGTYSEQDGLLFLHLNEKRKESSFASKCRGSTWVVGADKMSLKIPVSFHEDGKILAFHQNDEPYYWVVNVLVKKES